MRRFTPKEDAFIIANRMKMPQKRMAKVLGRSDGTVRQRLLLLGKPVPKTIAEKFANESKYKPGSIPFNKGKGMSYEIRQKVKGTWFKKGHQPANTKSDGVITIREDKRGIKYKFIRVGLSNWIPYHHYRWVKYRGEIPKGSIVVFKDRNTLNCKINNLECISRSENMKRNSIQNLPPEVKKVKYILTGFTRKLNKYVKDNQ